MHNFSFKEFGLMVVVRACVCHYLLLKLKIGSPPLMEQKRNSLVRWPAAPAVTNGFWDWIVFIVAAAPKGRKRVKNDTGHTAKTSRRWVGREDAAQKGPRDSLGIFLVARYVRSLALLKSLTHSAALCFVTFVSLAHSIHGLAHSLCSLSREIVETLEYVFTLKTHFTGTIEVLVVTGNTSQSDIPTSRDAFRCRGLKLKTSVLASSLQYQSMIKLT